MKTYSSFHELSLIIRDYIDLGYEVEKPLFISCPDDWIRQEIQSSFGGQRSLLEVDLSKGLGVEGHPFKRGHRHFVNKDGETELISDHPELTNRFFPPVRFDEEEPNRYKFFINAASYQYAYHLPYFVECVNILKKPFICVEPIKWLRGIPGNDKDLYLKENTLPDLSEFDEVTIKENGSFLSEWMEWARKQRGR